LSAEPGKASFTSFDLSGKVNVLVTYPSAAIQSVKILPSTSGITPTISGSQITFPISAPGQFTLEVNGDAMNSLHIFANSIETGLLSPPSATGPNVVYFPEGTNDLSSLTINSNQVLYFAPGIHYLTQTLTVPPTASNVTVYLAEGSIIYGESLNPDSERGPIFLLQGTNTTLRGRGIIDRSLITTWDDSICATPNSMGGNANAIFAKNATNLQIEGVVMRGSDRANLYIQQSQQVSVSNIKAFGSIGTSVMEKSQKVVDLRFEA
jgi:hypothetical protein